MTARLDSVTITLTELPGDEVEVRAVGHSTDSRAPLWHVLCGRLERSEGSEWGSLGVVMGIIGTDLWAARPATLDQAQFVIDGGLKGYWQDPLF